MEFGEWLCREIVKAVPHRHVVLSIPKILRRYFLYDRKLLSDLSRCGWESLKVFYTAGVGDDKAISGAVIAIQTFSDFLGFHPHLHILVSDGFFYKNGMFSVSPYKGEQMVRYYGYYSNAARGKRKKAAYDDQIPCIMDPEPTGKAFQKNWARLIQKIYEVDPRICSKCQGQMRVIAFIHDEDVIRKILKHLNLWDVKHKIPPRAHAPPIDFHNTYNQSPMPSVDDQLIDIQEFQR